MSDRIVVTGMSVKTPLGDTLDGFRDARLAGRSAISRWKAFYVVPIDYPAVPEDAVRFRISISAAHTRADLDEALDVIEGVLA